MFFILSKLLTFLLMPYTQMVLWFLLAIFLRNQVWKKRFLWAGILYLIFFSNRFIANEALLWWEEPPVPIDSLKSTFEFGVVLGGTTNTDKEPRDRIYIYKSAERMTHAAQLYKSGIIKKILVTGGSSNILDTRFKEAESMRSFLELMGIPAEDIIVEDSARNTYENAKFSADIIHHISPGARCLIITSGFHMRRSMACFRKTGLRGEAFSTDFYAKNRKFTFDILILPDVSAFSDWQMMIREWQGILLYKMAGYI